MDAELQHALAHDSLIDITTRGRKTGQPHRIEIRFHNREGHLYIMGRPPRPRDWYASLLAHPELTFHLKATPMLDPARRRAILAAIHQQLGRYQDIEAWVESNLLVAVELLVEYADHPK
jgi:hypothetical protein